MSTVADVIAAPASGLNHIDALLEAGPGWNWLAPARNTLLYTFSLAGGRAADKGTIYTGATASFNAAQQAAAAAALDKVGQITGIRFQATSDGNAADIHFSSADLRGPATAGFASTSWSYEFNGDDVVTQYAAGAWVYLDNVDFAASNATPTSGTAGFEVLLHEVGHALGLKHPFEDDVRLPPAEDDTAHTLMSYTHRGGPYSDYAPYDAAALLFLYGGDGLGGALGHGSPGRYLLGTVNADSLAGGSGSDQLLGGNGNDQLRGGGGNDTLTGGPGIDTVHYGGTRADYQLQRSGNGALTVQALAGSDGRDSLTQVERLAFGTQGQQRLAFDLDGAAGTTARYLGAVFGKAAVANAEYAGIGLGLLDGGTSKSALMQLALDARLGAGFTREALVDTLYSNLAGSLPSASDRAFYVGQLASGQHSAVTLAQMAAELDLNAQNIDLVGLTASGLPYLG